MAEPELIPLAVKHERFVQEYMVDLNGTQAAIRAGYSEKTARSQASRLLTHANIQAHVTARRQELSTHLEVTVETIAEELRKLGFSNMGDYYRLSEGGDPILDFSDLTRDQKAALSELTVEDFMASRGPNGNGDAEHREVRRVKFKLTDKRAALVDLAKLLGLMQDKVSHRHEVSILDLVPNAQGKFED